MHDDPFHNRHNLTAYVCRRHFDVVLRPYLFCATESTRERDEARDYANQWVEAVLANYPVGWAFDPTQPRMMVDNLVRSIEAPPPQTYTTSGAPEEPSRDTAASAD
jgi:hypothetical protein